MYYIAIWNEVFFKIYLTVILEHLKLKMNQQLYFTSNLLISKQLLKNMGRNYCKQENCNYSYIVYRVNVWHQSSRQEGKIQHSSSEHCIATVYENNYVFHGNCISRTDIPMRVRVSPHTYLASDPQLVIVIATICFLT